MHSIISLSLLAASAVAAATLSSANSKNGDIFRRGDQSDDTACDAWNGVASDLLASFVDEEGACTDDARAAIRVSFHDCFPEACDGSLILSLDECARAENTQMIGICATLAEKAAVADVNGADLVQLAAALGVAVCKGPIVSFLIGRQATTTANLEGQMPGPDTDADTMVQIWSDRGFTPAELVALTGAHTVAKTLTGQQLDSTVSQWDSSFYDETAFGEAPASIASDVNLANGTETAETWSVFGADQQQWDAVFVPAFDKMATMGNDLSLLQDCSGVVTSALSGSAKLRRRV